MVVNLKDVKEWADEKNVYVHIEYNTNTYWANVTVTLKDLPSYSMKDTFNSYGNMEFSFFLNKLYDSLKNKQQEDMKNYPPRRKSAEIDIRTFFDNDDNYMEWQFGPIIADSDFTINPDYCQELVDGWITTNFDPLLAKTESFLCDTCKGSGMVDYGFYGAAECPDCKEQWDKENKKEKPLSAWDKKLKEELENGDDTWGQISRKYKK
jgi:hypothetical protein